MLVGAARETDLLQRLPVRRVDAVDLLAPDLQLEPRPNGTEALRDLRSRASCGSAAPTGVQRGQLVDSSNWA